MVFYDVTSEISFKNVRNWMSGIQVCEKTSSEIVLFFIYSNLLFIYINHDLLRS